MLIHDAQDGQHSNISFTLFYVSRHLSRHLFNRLLTAPVGAIGRRLKTQKIDLTQTLTTNEHVLVGTVSGGVYDRLYPIQRCVSLVGLEFSQL